MSLSLSRGGRARRFRLTCLPIHGVHKRHPQRCQTLLQELCLLLVEVAPGFDFEHFQLVDEQPGAVDVPRGLSSFRMRYPAEHHQGEVCLLHNQVGKERGHHLFATGVGRRVLGRYCAIHGLLSLLCRRISAIRKWIRCFSRFSRSTVSSRSCRSTGEESSVPDTRSAICSGLLSLARISMPCLRAKSAGRSSVSSSSSWPSFFRT